MTGRHDTGLRSGRNALLVGGAGVVVLLGPCSMVTLFCLVPLWIAPGHVPLGETLADGALLWGFTVGGGGFATTALVAALLIARRDARARAAVPEKDRVPDFRTTGQRIESVVSPLLAFVALGSVVAGTFVSLPIYAARMAINARELGPHQPIVCRVEARRGRHRVGQRCVLPDGSVIEDRAGTAAWLPPSGTTYRAMAGRGALGVWMLDTRTVRPAGADAFRAR